MASLRAAPSGRVRLAIVTDQLLDPGHQVPGRERLGNVEVRAHRQALAHFGVASLRREPDDFYVPPVGAVANARAHFVAALARHQYVEQHEVGIVGVDQLQSLISVARDLHLVTGPQEEKFERRHDARLVVGNQDLLAHCTALAGRTNEKRAPLPGLLSTHMRPPKCSTICRLICRPRPLPCGLGVSGSPTWWNLLKIASCSSGLMPCPLSNTSTRRL